MRLGLFTCLGSIAHPFGEFIGRGDLELHPDDEELRILFRLAAERVTEMELRRKDARHLTTVCIPRSTISDNWGHGFSEQPP